MVQEAVYSGPSSFAQFDDEITTFVDKSLAIEAFLRDRGVTTSFCARDVVERAASLQGRLLLTMASSFRSTFDSIPFYILTLRMFMEPHTKKC